MEWENPPGIRQLRSKALGVFLLRELVLAVFLFFICVLLSIRYNMKIRLKVG